MRSLTHPPKPAHLFIYSCEYQCVTHFRPSLSLFFFFWQTLFVVTLVFLSSTFVVIVSSSFPTRRIKPHVSDHGAVIAIFFFCRNNARSPVATFLVGDYLKLHILLATIWFPFWSGPFAGSLACPHVSQWVLSLWFLLSKRITVSGVRHFSFDIFLFSLPA